MTPLTALLTSGTVAAAVLVAPLMLSLVPASSARARHAVTGAALAVVVLVTAVCAATAAPARGNLSAPERLAAPVEVRVGSEPGAPASRQMIERVALREAWAWVGTAWLLGVALLGARLATSLARDASFRRHYPAATDPRLCELFARCRQRLGVTRAVRLVHGAAREMPAASGVLRPAVVLPPDATQWSDARLEAVLLHELAHVARADAAVQVVAHAARVLQWCNPVVWAAVGQLERDAELACDAAVVRTGADPYDYADHLIQIARDYRAHRAGHAALAMAGPSSELERRVHALVAGARTAQRHPGSLRTGILAAVAVAAVVGSGVWRRWWGGERWVEVARPAFHGVVVHSAAIAAGSPTEWHGYVNPGGWLEFVALSGKVRIVPSPDSLVHLRIDVTHADGNGSPSLRIWKGADGDVRACVTADAPECALPSAAPRASDAVIVVSAPPSVHVSVHTGRGDIEGHGLSSLVWATTKAGRIDVATTALVEASTDSGDVVARIGRTTWETDVELSSGHGDVRVTVPGDVSATAELTADEGRIHADFALPMLRARRPQAMALGPLSAVAPTSAGRLTVRAERGDVILLKQ